MSFKTTTQNHPTNSLFTYGEFESPRSFFFFLKCQSVTEIGVGVQHVVQLLAAAFFTLVR